jgi:ABC-type phosphate/phosphonate transport system substrate-binding protein
MNSAKSTLPERREFLGLVGAGVAAAATGTLTAQAQTGAESPRAAAFPTRLTLSYYPWITQSISGPELARAIAAFVDLLQAALRQTLGNALQIDLLPEMEIPDQLKELKEKPAGGVAGKIGLLNPIGYALAHRDVPDVEAIAVIRRKIGTEPAGPTYRAQLYTHRKTAIKTVREVRGRSIAFGSPQSTSNFLVPAVMLWEQGVHPLNGLTKVEFAGGHDKAAIAVYEGRVDVGAGHDGVILDLANRPGFGDAADVLKRIAWSERILSDPVAVHISDADLRKHVREALIRIAKRGEPESDGNKAVHRFWGTKEGFDPISADDLISSDDYVPLLRMMYPLGLRADDMLRKI